MADKWDAIRQYASTGTTTQPGLSAAPGTLAGADTLNANPGIQRGGATGPLQTPPPTPHEPDRGAVGPEPDRLPAPPAGGTSAVKAFTARLKRIDDGAARIPTPGGLGSWALALAFLLFAVVKFGGYTRLQLVWYALTGAAQTGDYVGSVASGIATVANQKVASAGASSTAPAGAAGAASANTAPANVPGGFTPRSVAGGGV